MPRSRENSCEKRHKREELGSMGRSHNGHHCPDVKTPRPSRNSSFLTDSGEEQEEEENERTHTTPTSRLRETRAEGSSPRFRWEVIYGFKGGRERGGDYWRQLASSKKDGGSRKELKGGSITKTVASGELQ